MANLILKIKNSKFVESNEKYQIKFGKKVVEGNGWIAKIDKYGNIKCQAKRVYTDGEYEMRYNVCRNGYAKLTLKTPDMEKAKILKGGFITPKGEGIKNGVLALAGGRIDERFAYFRGESFMRLLEKHNLKGIKRIDPNREYEMTESIQCGVKKSDSIATDGTVEAMSKEKIMDNKKSGNRTYKAKVKVSNATWAILCLNGNRFLYTQIQDIDSINIDD